MAGAAAPAAAAEPDGGNGRLAGRDFTTLPIAEEKVALTFDCGSGPDGVDAVLAALGTRALPATFFMTGRFASAHAAAARRIAGAYPVGNHSMTHPAFPGLRREQRVEEVRSAAYAIERAVGRPPVPLFRFPFGEVDRESIADVNAEGYTCVRWTVDTLGWKGAAAGVTTDTVVARVLDALTPGAIVLMHVGRTGTADPSTVDATALPHVIEAIAGRGYGFTSLEALMG
ncbi:polysaccharide deacetylase family protein [Streptomyces sp. I05A-00742]|uniref:polysaccharide deacetylase family protein n=1 Tax=Streptomyces sp. I05A-00742 TaxID=2732853 RepID=UPI001488E9BD|nr:polysaccharide deacetylase family protein [Streptomyces sp. I05A-00742]